MKSFKTVIITGCVLVCTLNLFAQMNDEKAPKHCFVQNKVADLSPDQQTKIETIELAHLKKIQQLRSTKHELQAHLQTLEVAETPSLDAINKQIDLIGANQIAIMKERAAFRQQIRALLTEKQRIMFDMAIQEDGGRHCHGHQPGMHHGKHFRGRMHEADDMPQEAPMPEKIE